MSLYKIEIDLDNDAFQGQEGMEAMEVSRILEELVLKMNQTGVLGDTSLRDLNGSRVGQAVLELDEEGGGE